MTYVLVFPILQRYTYKHNDLIVVVENNEFVPCSERFFMKILLVDDSNTMLMTMERMLKELGYSKVLKTQSPVDAVKIVKATKIDLILLDWNMPEMAGLDLLIELKGNEKTRHIPVIMVTADGTTERVGKAIENGAEGFIVKPVNKDALKIRLQDIAESNKLGLKY